MALETPEYELITKYQKIEIRDYKNHIVAKTFVDNNYKEAGNIGFSRISNFIFGGNDKRQEIAMTAPVITTSDSTRNRHEILFFMPKKYKLEELPTPNRKDVTVEERKLGKVAVVSFGGWATEKNVKFYTQELEKYLKLNSIQNTGEFMVAQYNSPWVVPPFRKNEILVKIN